MMYCPYCGTKCEDSHRFCYHCGQALPVIAPAESEQEEQSCEAVVKEESLPAQAEELAIQEPESEEAASEAVPAETSAAEDFSESVSASNDTAPVPKKGRLWPPVLAMTVMICVGLLIFFLFPYGASGSDTPWFTMEDGKLYFDPTLYTGTGELVIPSTVDGETVTYIAENAFNDCDSITTVILPDTLTQIGEYAFSGCDGLRGIYIPTSVTQIGSHAFYDCNGLEAIYLSNTLNKLSDDALGSCDSLKFIFFDGSYSEWARLYDGSFLTKVELHTNDGTYYFAP